MGFKYPQIRRFMQKRRWGLGKQKPKKNKYTPRWKKYPRRNRRTGTLGLYNQVMKRPLADIVTTKHPYAYIGSFELERGFTNTGTLDDTYLYHRIFQTSMHDPDYTLTGHQPFYADQISGYYKSYRVSGIKWNVEITAPQGGWMFVEYSSDTTSYGNTTVLLESRTIQKYHVPFASAGVLRARGYMATHQALGVNRNEFLADETTIGAVGANPARMGYLNFYFKSRLRQDEYGTGNDKQYFSMRCTLTYYTQWMAMQKIAIS